MTDLFPRKLLTKSGAARGAKAGDLKSLQSEVAQ